MTAGGGFGRPFSSVHGGGVMGIYVVIAVMGAAWIILR